MEQVVAPRESVLGSGAGGPLTAPTQWNAFQGYIQYSYGVVIGNPTGGNKGNGTLNLDNGLYLDGVIVDLTKYLLLTGGTLSGKLTLAMDPTNPFDAATKKYVDAQIVTVNGNFASYLPLVGGTLTGPLTLPADPTTDFQAATKIYVDNKTSSLIGIADAPSDGTTYGRKNAAWVNASLIDVGTY
jgi:hypothetical protein